MSILDPRRVFHAAPEGAGAIHISNHDDWHHFEKINRSDVKLNVSLTGVMMSRSMVYVAAPNSQISFGPPL